jgi:hypothetical protein
MYAKTHEEWLGNYHSQAFRHNIQQIDWITTFKWFRYKETQSSTSMNLCKDFVFKLQNLNKLLPTLSKLTVQQPNIYPSSLKCSLCHIDKESWKHIWTCPFHNNILNKIIEEFLTHISSMDNDLIMTSFENLKDILIRSQILSFPSKNLFWLLRGIIPISLSNIMKNRGLSKSQTTHILLKGYNFLFQQIRNRIWIPRCTINNNHLNTIGITGKVRKRRNKKTGT